MRKLWRFYFLISACVFAVDMASKWAVVRILKLDSSDPIQIVPGLLALSYVENQGVAFGLLQNVDLPLKQAMLLAVALFAIVALILYARRMPPQMTAQHAALALVLGGIFGNSFDRVLRGYVVDFIDLHWRRYHWPTFNIADSAITVGVLVLMFGLFRSQNPENG